jgi:branched-chain amino acid transport system permease protein
MEFSAFDLIQAIIKGLLTGMVYSLMALGLTVIFGVMRVVNFAHGEMMIVAMYLAVMAFGLLGIDPMLALIPIAGILFAFGYTLQRTVINRFINVPEHMQFILMLAIAIILVNACLLLAGPDAQGVQLDYALDSFEIGALLVDKTRVYAAIGSLVIAFMLFLFFSRTRTGKAIRAAADNYAGALVVGLDVKRLYAITFGIGAACVGAAGSLTIMLVQAQPFLAVEYTLLAFTIVIIGGLGSLRGAIAGGLLIGVSEAVAGFLLEPSLKSVFSFGLLILVLLIRPQGLFGKPA